VLVDLATRLASIPLIAAMVVAIITAQWENIASLNDLFATIECLYAVLLIGLVIYGAGKLSFDFLIARRLDPADPLLPRHAPPNTHVRV